MHVCVRCRANARHRALVEVLAAERPSWPGLDLYEPGANGRASAHLLRRATSLRRSVYVPGAPPGSIVDPTADGDAVELQDLEALSFDDDTFDVVITQDVLEHVFEPARALSEIARVLRPGGLHLFTVPVVPDLAVSRRRARRSDVGVVELLEPATYHDDPLDPAGALVVHDFGDDLAEQIERWSAMPTERRPVVSPPGGRGPAVDVWLSHARGG
jgi:SAM-dependent methyltransferase